MRYVKFNLKSVQNFGGGVVNPAISDLSRKAAIACDEILYEMIDSWVSFFPTNSDVDRLDCSLLLMYHHILGRSPQSSINSKRRQPEDALND